VRNEKSKMKRECMSKKEEQKRKQRKNETASGNNCEAKVRPHGALLR